MENFNLNNNIAILGTNKIIVSKNYYFDSPVFFLDINNKKIEIKDYIKISDNQYEIKFNLNKKTRVKIFIKDGIIEESEQFYFIQEDNFEPNINLDDLKITTSFLKDKIFLNIKKSTPLKKDTSLKFEGDLNKTIFWRSGTNQIDINFPYQVKGFVNLTFKINNVLKKVKVLNIDDFPRNLINIKGGLKLNKSCEWDLKLISNTSEYVIKKGTSFIYIDLNGDETFKLYIDDFYYLNKKFHIILTYLK